MDFFSFIVCSFFCIDLRNWQSLLRNHENWIMIISHEHSSKSMSEYGERLSLHAWQLGVWICIVTFFMGVVQWTTLNTSIPYWPFDWTPVTVLNDCASTPNSVATNAICFTLRNQCRVSSSWFPNVPSFWWETRQDSTTEMILWSMILTSH